MASDTVLVVGCKLSLFKPIFRIVDKELKPDHATFEKDTAMDASRGPLYSGPMFPIGSHDKSQPQPQPLQGTIVGIRPGRRGEETAQIVTIKLSDPDQDLRKLVQTDVVLLVQPGNS